MDWTTAVGLVISLFIGLIIYMVGWTRGYQSCLNQLDKQMAKRVKRETNEEAHFV